ncbi:hypothetical protein, unlikely [Trypanosoma brucei gambiense DAL972]|uniref:Uncharacterized protein n=1 Tax=Trypanosoma brucei gambiense (strain MHOM/CI/86/DAL972) TaxID=679716 RepID=C9ZSI5_TRYB9|nr:hypothetical protein, unlikely [Trypanosoma brucei gambiense DAL972]CBH12369.1 hypothetical protein, unlikely [Trypanosoma brucei gambiense DAL972]|eukprot:XP_011774650.1 hypothetical protein, unlikely [Trypanosoma brucei gambiense DAL972]
MDERKRWENCSYFISVCCVSYILYLQGGGGMFEDADSPSLCRYLVHFQLFALSGWKDVGNPISSVMFWCGLFFLFSTRLVIVPNPCFFVGCVRTFYTLLLYPFIITCLFPRLVA